MKRDIKVVALAGGVGGAKLADGFAQLISGDNLTIIVNTGDDFDHFGLKICPDLDTVCYTLAGLANPDTGWGRDNETWGTFENIKRLGGETWFQLGDKDLATHIVRTQRLKNGDSLSQITDDFCSAWGVDAKVIPMSDDPVPTLVLTEEGELSFQEYFVHRQCQPVVRGFRFTNCDQAIPAPGLLKAIGEAERIVFCPSNPWVSIGPILAIPGIKQALLGKKVIAVSPIVGGSAIKGPAAKMYQELGITPSAVAVANHYQNIVQMLVFDRIDKDEADEILNTGIFPYFTDTIMRTKEDRKKLAQEILKIKLEN